MNFSWKIAAAVFFLMIAVDFTWIGLLANKFYLEQLGPIGRITDGKFQIVPWAAVGVYVLLTAALLTFVMPLVAANDPWWKAALYGGVLGLCVYGVYDFTNHATLQHWPLQLLIVDVSWGTFLLALAATAAKLLRD